MDIEYCLNISFTESGKNYYFKTTDNTIKIGDYVVVNTVVGLELGKVTTDSRLLSEVKAPFEIIPIVRKATKQDLLIYKRNKLDAIQAKEIFNKFANQEHLSMDLVDAQYTLDKTKILFTYIAADRVDFRNLLKLLAGSLHCRIELRQVNVRERAQIIGGIGVCGLPLCCTTFLKEFEGVSLSKAKNQMLTINIPKLSGQCGKLMCCLKFEDEAYSEEKKNFPAINTNVKYNDELYKVTSFNIISKIIRIETKENVEYITLEDFKKLKKVSWKAHYF